MEVFFFVFVEGGFYDFVACFLVFFVFDYGGVHVWFLEGVDFLESRGFFGDAAYYGWRLGLLECGLLFYDGAFLRCVPSLGELGFRGGFQKI